MMIHPVRRSRQNTRDAASIIMSEIKQQWLWLFNKGKVTFPPLAATAALANLYVAYALYVGARSDSKLAPWYIVAAVSTLSIGPFTALMMIPTYDSLERLAKGGAAAAEKDEEKVKETDEEDGEFIRLLTKWARWNSVRALLPLTGAVVGLAAAMH